MDRDSRARCFGAAARIAVAAVVALVACSDEARPPGLRGPYEGLGGAGGIDFDGGTSGPPPVDADASGICGNEVHPLIVDAPNLYFVLDASGSMKAPAGNGTLYDAVR